MPETHALAEAIFVLSKRSWTRAAQQTSEVTETGFLALDYLVEAGTDSVGEVQQHINVIPAQMSRLVRQLGSDGLIESNINREDRRKIDLTITEQGREVHARYRDAKLAPIIASLERLTADERAQFMVLVRKMAGQ